MYGNKEKIINEVDLLKGNQDLLKRVMAGMRRKIQVFKEIEDILMETEISRLQ